MREKAQESISSIEELCDRIRDCETDPHLEDFTRLPTTSAHALVITDHLATIREEFAPLERQLAERTQSRNDHSKALEERTRERDALRAECERLRDALSAYTTAWTDGGASARAALTPEREEQDEGS